LSKAIVGPWQPATFWKAAKSGGICAQ
jgi:hypothetical protein